MQNEMRLELKKLLEGSLEVDPGAAVMLELMSTYFHAFPSPCACILVSVCDFCLYICNKG